MWASKASKWAEKSTAFERFAIERIIQRCDFGEVIGNKHRTINGFIQLKELIRLSELSLKRGKTIRTVIVSLEEAKSEFIKQNISNDYIINKYFIDLKFFIKSYSTNKLIDTSKAPNLTEINTLIRQLKLFEIQLNENYYNLLKVEFLNINTNDTTQFERTADHISILVDLFVPYLIFMGYSTETITGILIRWLKNEYHISIGKLFSIFRFTKRDFLFYIVFKEENKETEDFETVLSEYINARVIKKRTSDLGNKFLGRYNYTGTEICLEYRTQALDPNSSIRTAYDKLIKKIVTKKERQSLATFNTFFESCYWSFSSKTNGITKISLDGDPINVNSRGLTLKNTLLKTQENGHQLINEDDSLPTTENEQLNNAIFYYNLALGSKSIENSLSLLWTSLESILPYRTASSDVECVQNLVSKSLSLGCFTREISGFALRFIQQNQQNENSIGDCGTRGFESHNSEPGLNKWFNWIIDEKNAKKRFPKIKGCSELLAYEYSKLGRAYSKGDSKFLLNRIMSSSESIKFQIQRIYIHRNQIIHAGDFINEYTNLWMNLEWYVGKILSCFLISIHYHKSYKTIEESAMKLESDYDYLVSYLEKNKSKEIALLPDRIKKIIFNNSWQSF